MIRKASVVGCLVVGGLAALARPVPSTALMERLRAEEDVIGIVHWGLNTFTDREWGYGDENPSDLNPSKFDADQIAKACAAGGLKGLVIVAKHHDGFCLWPTKTTEHNITKSPFRGGKGDYVREMADACRKAGMRFGVYVSPWDRNSADYGTAKYVETYHAQIRELLGAFFANELTDSAKPFNLIVLREDLSKGERVEDWSFLVNDEKVLSGKWIGHKCIRILDRPTAARHGVRVVADKGTVSHRLYFVDPELVRLVLSATTESGETDTAKWMTALSSLLIIR